MSVNVLLIPAVLCLGELCSICTAPGDYASGGYSLSFSAGQTSGMLSVQTSDDTIAECDEFFKVMITGSDQQKVKIGGQDTRFATIVDNDGEIIDTFMYVYGYMYVTCVMLIKPIHHDIKHHYHDHLDNYVIS